MKISQARIAASLTILCICAAAASAQKKPLDKETLRAADLNGIELGAVLASIAADYSVTIGFEAYPNRPQSPIEVHLRDVNYMQFIDGLVRADRRYQWHEHDGFIEVLPVNQEISLLETPIANFQVKDVSRELALNRLFGLPSVQAQALLMGLKVRTPLPPAEKPRDEKLSFNLSGVTLRQALNLIARDSGARFWTARKSPDGTYEIKLSCC